MAKARLEPRTYINISVGGKDSVSLRKKITSYLSHVGFGRVKKKRTLPSTYVGKELNPSQSSALTASLFDIESTYAGRAHIKQIRVACFPTIDIRLKE